MAYDSYLPNNWWGNDVSKFSNSGPAAFGPDGKAIPFDQRGPTAPGATPAPASPAATTPVLPDYSQIQNIIQQINATNQQAQTNANNSRIPMAPQLQQQSSRNIADLLNPPHQFAEMDVPAAAAAVASGTVGSPFAGHTGIRLSENERLRRMGLGESFLSGALARNPAAPIANPESLVQMLSQQMYGAGQNQLNRDLQERIANAEMANAALRNRNNVNAYNNRSGSYGPSLPTQYGRPDSFGMGGNTTGIPALPDQFGPGQLPPLPPNIGGLDNWNQLNTWQKDDYTAALGQNPYFGLPDWQNPYSGDTQPIQNNPMAPGDFPYDPQLGY